MPAICEHLTLAFLQGFAEPQCEQDHKVSARILALKSFGEWHSQVE